MEKAITEVAGGDWYVRLYFRFTKLLSTYCRIPPFR
jgi:hypothetical protein